jgi:hypothetical protein
LGNLFRLPEDVTDRLWVKSVANSSKLTLS